MILTVPHTPETEGFMNRDAVPPHEAERLLHQYRARHDDPARRPRRGACGPARSPAPALDVFEQEPLPADHPLWTMPGVLITPHTAGHGPYLDERRFEVLSDNCRRFAAGQELRNVVDKARWF